MDLIDCSAILAAAASQNSAIVAACVAKHATIRAAQIGGLYQLGAGICALLAAMMAALIAYRAANQQTRMQNKRNTDRGLAYREFILLKIEDAYLRARLNKETLFRNKQPSKENPLTLFLYKDLEILSPDNWETHSMLGRDSARRLMRIYSLMSEGNDFAKRYEHGPLEGETSYWLFDYEQNIRVCLEWLPAGHKIIDALMREIEALRREESSR